MNLDSDTLDLRRIEVFVFRAPVTVPVRTSFGSMDNRPAVVVRVEDRDGAHGWGEIWCNFPSCGAEHRAQLVDTVFAPRLLRRQFSTPVQVTETLLRETHALRLQTREHGPLDQAIAGLDVALWDLYTRRRNQPLHRVLGSGQRSAVPVYASGINPQEAQETIDRCRGEGFNAFKVKIGFHPEQDKDLLAGLFDNISHRERLMADANQAWTPDTALARVADMDLERLEWLEEPMPVDAALADWKQLAAVSPVALAGGENFASESAFSEAVDHKVLSVLQPDLCKWGGVTGIFPIACNVLEAGHRYCPHYLGGGIGLIASAHCLAAAGGDGLLEVDGNPNPLRSLLAQPFPSLTDGVFGLPKQAGLGVEPDLTAVEPYLVHYREYS